MNPKKLRAAAANLSSEGGYYPLATLLRDSLQEVGYSQEEAIAFVGRFFLEVPHYYLALDTANEFSRKQLKELVERKHERKLFSSLNSKTRTELFGEYACDVDLRKLSTYFVLLRSFPFDGEAVYESPVDELSEWLPFLSSQGVIIKAEEVTDTKGTKLSINGEEVALANGTEGDSTWYVASKNLLGLINSLLRDAGSDYRILLFNNGETVSFVSSSTRAISPWNEIDVYYREEPCRI